MNERRKKKKKKFFGAKVWRESLNGRRRDRRRDGSRNSRRDAPSTRTTGHRRRQWHGTDGQ